MDGSEYLIVIAEIAVAFAGFASIVAVFHQRREAWSELQALRIRTMLQYGLIAMFFALLPISLAWLGIPANAVWRISGGTGALVIFVNATFFVLRDYRRLARRGDFAIRTNIMKIVSGVGYAVCAVLLVSATGLVPIDPKAVYAIFLLWAVCTSGVMFALLVTSASET